MNIHFLYSLLFPPVCLSCEKRISEGALCGECRAGIDLCAAPPRAQTPGAPCKIGAAAHYSAKALQVLIHNLKFRGIRAAAEPIADVLIHYTEARRLELAQCVAVPIPLSKRRLRERGFNQAELIARRFAAHFGIPLETNLLTRILHRKPQSDTADLAERKANIRGVFAANPWRTQKMPRILLIDDVTTSGSTFLEAAGALKAAGAHEITALAAAQA